MILGKSQQNEYNFLKYVIMKLNKETWDETDLENIYKKYELFLERMNLNELSMLRVGESMLGEYCEVDLANIQDVKDLVTKCLNAFEEITIPVCIVIIGALTKLALSTISGREDFNKLKGEQ